MIGQFVKKYAALLSSGLAKLKWSRKLGRFGEGASIDGNVSIKNGINVHLGDNVSIKTGVVMWPRSNKIHIGDGTGVNPYVCIYGAVSIGANCLIAPHVMLAAGDHDIRVDGTPMIRKPGLSKPIEIGDDVWVGANAVITGGVTIGEGAVIGAGSVVTRDVGAYEIFAGVPAQKIGCRDSWDQREGIDEQG